MSAARTARCLLLCALLAAASACGGESDETLVRRLVDEVAAAAEKGDAGRLEAVLAASYRDDEGRDRAATAALLRDTHARLRGIVVHVLEVRIEALRPPDALLEADVALSSGAAEALRRIVRFSGECYRFRCRLLRESGTWRVAGAGWLPVDTSDLTGSAARTLRQLFPLL